MTRSAISQRCRALNTELRDDEQDNDDELIRPDSDSGEDGTDRSRIREELSPVRWRSDKARDRFGADRRGVKCCGDGERAAVKKHDVDIKCRTTLSNKGDYDAII